MSWWIADLATRLAAAMFCAGVALVLWGVLSRRPRRGR